MSRRRPALWWAFFFYYEWRWVELEGRCAGFGYGVVLFA